MNDLAAVNGVEPPRLASQDSGGASAGSAAGGAGDNSSATASGTDSRPDSASSSGSLQSGPVRYTLQWMIDWEVRPHRSARRVTSLLLVMTDGVTPVPHIRACR